MSKGSRLRLNVAVVGAVAALWCTMTLPASGAVVDAGASDDSPGEALEQLSIPNADDVRGNITLPSEVDGSPITWQASPAGVITTDEAGGKPAGVVTRGEADVDVTLTASVPGTDATRDLLVTVTAAPTDLDTDYSAGYLWTHFAVDGGYEKIFLGHSEDGLHWSKLNQNAPVLENLGGDLGVRDPHLVRSAEGDRYWIIGTDLHAEGGGPGGSGWDQLGASQNIVVWESTDLVNWSDQRIVFAGFDRAGNVWAPEAVYNEETGEYYVYWSARDQRDDGTDDWALRVYLTKTRDFVTFTEPEIWASLNEQGSAAGGPNIIDSTIAEEDGTYYRFSTSDWHTVIDTAPSLDGPWTTVVARGEAAAHGLRASMEGLTVYRLPDDRWAVMGDQGGYHAHVTDSLASLDFTELTAGAGDDQYSFDRTFRHGSVLRLSAAEEARLLAAYGDDAGTDPDPEPEQQEPIAEYTFDDGTPADSRGGADLTTHGSAAVVTDAERGQVLSLDGATGGYASFARGFFDGRDTVTISMDVRSQTASGNFFTFAVGTDQTNYYFLRIRGGELRSAITVGSWQNESAVTGAVTADQWHHIDIVVAGRSMTVYADGHKLGENTNLSTSVGGLGRNLEGYLGRSFYAADGYFTGQFDNLRIYNRELTTAEILEGAGATDQLGDVSLADPSVLAFDPVIDTDSRTVTFPVKRGTDVSDLAPTFIAAGGVQVDPESGTAVDLTTPVTYTLTAPDGATTEWTFATTVVGSPVLPGLYADPNIAVFGDTYYIYATSDGYAGWGGKDFYVWKSKDLVDWERAEEPFLTLDGGGGNVPWASGNAWAPTIIERDGKYYFYFSGHNPTYNRKTIGVAVADDPEGPFVAQPEAMILNNEDVTSGQAIDPAAFLDPETGKYYLAWGNGGPGNGPVLAELADDMVSIKPGTFERINGLRDFREGVFLNYRDGTYHLTYSIDDTGSQNYRVGYVTSDSIHGPWTYHGVILEKDPSQGIYGTGHSSVLNVPGTDDWYIVYHRHAIPGGDGNHRETTIDRLPIGGDGLFQPVTPTLESVPPQLIGQSAVTVEPLWRCVVGKAVLVARVTNEGEAPVEVELETPFGSRDLGPLDGGSSRSQAFTTRQVSVDDARLTFRTDGGESAAVAIPGHTCG